MTMEHQTISEQEAIELTKRSANTFVRWRQGKYYRKGLGAVWYFPDQRRLQAKTIKRVRYYDLQEVLNWHNTITERTGAWRRK